MPFKLINPTEEDAPLADYETVPFNPDTTQFNDPGPSIDQSAVNQVAEKEKIIYTYHLDASSVHLQIIIAVEPVDTQSEKYTFTLSAKAGGVERTLNDPVVLKLLTGPRQLDFAAFLFPPKTSLPADCLFCLRVWLRTAQVEHRLFADNEFWIAKNPDFRSITDASFAQLTRDEPFMLEYQGHVGQALVKFIIRWNLIDGNHYKITMEYEAGFAGRLLLDDCRIRLDEGCDPQAIAFVIYSLVTRIFISSVPVKSTPPNASHRLRLWIRTPAAFQSPSSSANSLQNPTFIYQRIWKSDNFKIGSQLDFAALGSKLVMGVPDARGPQVEKISQNSPITARVPQWIVESDISRVRTYLEDRSGNAL